MLNRMRLRRLIYHRARDCSIRLQFARDEFLQLHNVRGKFANAFSSFFRGHRILVQKITEFLFIEIEALHELRLTHPQV